MSQPTWPMADNLSDTMIECLAIWPKDYFTEATRRAIMARGLANRSYGNKRTELGERVLKYLERKGEI